MIENDKELHFFIKEFQRAFEDEQETLTYNQLANLRIPLKIGIPTFLGKALIIPLFLIIKRNFRA